MYGLELLASCGPAAALAHPVGALAIAAAYTSSVFIGYKAMRARKRWRTGWLAPAHNLAMVVASVYTFGETCLALSATSDGDGDGRLARVVHVYFLLRLLALADTFFVIVRKRDRKLTILHVVHRAAMVFPAWSTAAMHPATNVALACATCSMMDVLVYAYYGVSSIGLGLAVRSTKRWLTRAQIAHATLLAGHAISLVVAGGSGVVPIIRSNEHRTHMVIGALAPVVRTRKLWSALLLRT